MKHKSQSIYPMGVGPHKTVITLSSQFIEYMNANQLDISDVANPIVMMDKLPDKEFILLLWFSKRYILSKYKFMDLTSYYKNTIQTMAGATPEHHEKLNSLCMMRASETDIKKMINLMMRPISGDSTETIVNFITSGQNTNKSMKHKRGFELVTINQHIEAVVPVTDFVILVKSKSFENTLAKVFSDKFTYTVMAKAAKGSILERHIAQRSKHHYYKF
jgi:hypothetical protein